MISSRRCGLCAKTKRKCLWGGESVGDDGVGPVVKKGKGKRRVTSVPETEEESPNEGEVVIVEDEDRPLLREKAKKREKSKALGRSYFPLHYRCFY